MKKVVTKKYPVYKDCATLAINIEDEDHFFLHCRINNQPRNLLFNIIGNYYSNFINMSDLNKLKYILNPNPDLSSDICTFIKQSLELR